jgi:thiol-disulfide isomerase/thioredoxin
MKRCVVAVFFLVIIFASCAWGEPVAGNQVTVYYFYGNVRCPTCYKIERYTQEAVEKYFGKEIKAGTVSFKAINVEGEKNQHYVKEYQLFSKAVVVSMIKEGKEVKFNNLTKIWEYVRDKEKFCQYIKTETAQYLEGIN